MNAQLKTLELEIAQHIEDLDILIKDAKARNTGTLEQDLELENLVSIRFNLYSALKTFPQLHKVGL